MKQDWVLLVDLDKDDFIGKKSLEAYSQKGEKRLFGLISDDPFKYKSQVYLSDDKSVGISPSINLVSNTKKVYCLCSF